MKQSERKLGVQRETPAIQPSALSCGNGDFYRSGALRKQVETAKALYDRNASALSEKRRAASQALSKAVSAKMQQLAMTGGKFALALNALAESEDCDALIALGCIIRGETYHFELVANESGSAVTRVSLDHGIPIANAVLTVENEAQARARIDEKGRDAARVAVEMANLMEDLS